MNGPNKLESYITLGWEGMSGTNSLPYWAQFVSHDCYDWVQYAWVLHYTWLERHVREKHFSLLAPFVSYDWVQYAWVLNYTRLERIAKDKRTTLVCPFAIFNWVQYAWVLYYIKLKRIAKVKQSSLLGPFLIYEKNEVLWIWHQWPALFNPVYFRFIVRQSVCHCLSLSP